VTASTLHRRLFTATLAAVAALALGAPTMAQSPVVGAVVAIGGGSEQPELIKDVLALAKGPASRVAILNTASSDPTKSGPAYQRFFQGLGVPQPTVVPLLERDQAYEPAVLDAIGRADLVYVTGGNQIKLAQTLLDTPAHGALLAAWQRGAVIAGTSAGAMVWGPRYLAAGESRAALAGQPLDMRAGLGLLPRVVVDTHFGKENRMGRLLVAASQQTGLIGLGVDERTAAVIGPQSVRVLGEGRVTVLDYAQAQRPAKPGGPFGIRGIQLHLLGAGDSLRWTRDEAERHPMLPPRPPADATLASLWLQGGPLPTSVGPSGLANALFGERPGEVLILAGEGATATAQRWQAALQASGVGRTPILSPTEIGRGDFVTAIGRAGAVLLLDDSRWSLARALVGEPARLLRSRAGVISLAGAGSAVAIPGDAAIQAGAGEVAAGLRLAPSVIPAPDWMAEGAIDRLVVDALLAGGALGVGLSPDSGVRVAGGTLTAQGASPVLVIQSDRVSLANPTVPTARDLWLHVLAPGETFKP
jgi:cyanophycinase